MKHLILNHCFKKFYLRDFFNTLSQHRTFLPLHHASYVTSQMAEVAVPSELFGKSSASSMGYGRRRCRHDGDPSGKILIA